MTPLLSLTVGFFCLFSLKGLNEENQWQVCVHVCMQSDPFSLCCPSVWWHGTIFFAFHPSCTYIATSCSTHIGRDCLCLFLCKWRATPLQCKPPAVTLLSYRAKEHSCATTCSMLCRKQLLSLVCNTCTVIICHLSTCVCHAGVSLASTCVCSV